MHWGCLPGWPVRQKVVAFPFLHKVPIISPTIIPVIAPVVAPSIAPPALDPVTALAFHFFQSLQFIQTVNILAQISSMQNAANTHIQNMMQQGGITQQTNVQANNFASPGLVLPILTTEPSNGKRRNGLGPPVYTA